MDSTTFSDFAAHINCLLFLEGIHTVSPLLCLNDMCDRPFGSFRDRASEGLCAAVISPHARRGDPWSMHTIP